MVARILWVYWEMPPGAVNLPPHIALCRKIMEQKAVGYTLKVVTPGNVKSYIPDLPNRLNKIALAARGMADKYFNRRGRRTAAIAIRADYIRAFLLERHGGIYLDSDAIILSDLVPLFEDVERSGFLICRRETFGKQHVSVGMYGSTPESPIIREYSESLRKRLAGNLEYDWNEIGAELLTPIVTRHLDHAKILPERSILPITFEEADEKFVSTKIEVTEVLTSETKIFMLYSGPFKRMLAGLDESELIRSDRLISKVFRYALEDNHT